MLHKRPPLIVWWNIYFYACSRRFNLFFWLLFWFRSNFVRFFYIVQYCFKISLKKETKKKTGTNYLCRNKTFLKILINCFRTTYLLLVARPNRSLFFLCVSVCVCVFELWRIPFVAQAHKCAVQALRNDTVCLSVNAALIIYGLLKANQSSPRRSRKLRSVVGERANCPLGCSSSVRIFWNVRSACAGRALLTYR